MLKLISFVWLCLLANLATSQTCPVTKVDQYRYSCSLQGTIENPRTITTIPYIHTETRCGGKCLKDKYCQSFRWVAAKAYCILYESYLENMNFTTEKVTPGEYSDRYCFSRDCQEINACDAVAGCLDVSGTYDYTNYACGYGLTSNFATTTTDITLFAGNLTACEVASQCGNGDGPFEVHFDLSSQQWVCLRDDVLGSDRNGEYNLQDEGINYMTFTVTNASVGASYGWWQIGMQ